MSHDNVIYIQERLDGNHWVWANRYDLGAPALDPSRDTANCFEDIDKAWAYAEGLYYGLGQHQTIEYGIRRLDPEQPKQKTYWDWFPCPHCKKLIPIAIPPKAE